MEGGLADLYDRIKESVDAQFSMTASRRGGPPVSVSFDLAVDRLLYFDQMSGVTTWSVYYRLLWNDDRLAYNGSEVVGPAWNSSRDSVPLESWLAWTPDVVPYRGSAGLEDMRFYLYDEDFLRANGHNVLWTRPGKVDVPCNTVLKHFPFDTQQCTLIVGPWADRSYSLRALRNGSISGRFAGSFQAEEWEVQSAFIASKRVEHMSGDFQEVHYTMTFSRYPHYYLVNAVFPMALTVALSILTMWLPIEGGSGERLGFSVTLLLTIMATSLFTAQFRPATHEDTWLDRFQACCMCLTFFPVFESALVVQLQYVTEKVGSSRDERKKGEEGSEVPPGRSAPVGAGGPPSGVRRGARQTITEFASQVRSSFVADEAKRSMRASLGMHLTVYVLRKWPQVESLITGRANGGVSPRDIDLAFRYAVIVVALGMTVQMAKEVPAEARQGFSVALLTASLLSSLALYLATAILAAAFLIFRIVVSCSERQVARANARSQEFPGPEEFEVVESHEERTEFPEAARFADEEPGATARGRLSI